MSAAHQHLFQQGIGALQQGQWDRAVEQFRLLAAQDTETPEPLYYLGISLLSGGRPGEAATILDRLVTKHGEHPTPLNALGSALAASGQPAKAEKTLRRALALAPGMGDATENLARLLLDTGRGGEAIAPLQAILAREPGRLASRLLLGRALCAAGDTEGAEAAFKAVLAANPDFPPALNDLGLLHYANGKGEDALDCFERLLRLNPADPVAANNRGLALRILKRRDEAEQQFRAILARFPDHPEVNLNLGKLLARMDRGVEAIPFLEKSNCVEARWWNSLILPDQYETEEQIHHWRRRFSEKLDAAAAEIDAMPPAQLAGLGTILEMDAYFLAYQAENDRDLLTRMRGAQTKVAQACFGYSAPVPRRAATGRIRVGFVSGELFNHTVCKLAMGWMTGLDRDTFEVFVFHTGQTRDEVTERLAAGVEHFIHLPAPIPEVARRVSETGLDVLIYPDIGINIATDSLAMLRLAPVQCAAWAHPLTSGIPAMDYFLNGELSEAEDADEHYTERLIRLPGIGYNMTRPPVEQAILPPPRPQADQPLFFCAQSLFKMLPRHDGIFPGIAKAVGPCTIDFVDRHGKYADIFRKRMDKAFAAHGLEAEHYIRIHFGINSMQFLGMLKAADVSLDTLEWCGGYTILESLACGTPAITVPGRFARGRLATGILRAAGLDELVVPDMDSYVALAARLGTDKAYREQISRTMLANGPQVFNSRAPINGLAAFLKSVARAS